MYTLLGIDAVLRITIALVLLFVVVPRLARRRPAELDRMEWFWWCFAAGVTLLTLGGQLFTLVNIYSTITLLLAIGAVAASHFGGRWVDNKNRVLVVGLFLGIAAKFVLVPIFDTRIYFAYLMAIFLCLAGSILPGRGTSSEAARP